MRKTGSCQVFENIGISEFDIESLPLRRDKSWFQEVAGKRCWIIGAAPADGCLALFEFGAVHMVFERRKPIQHRVDLGALRVDVVVI